MDLPTILCRDLFKRYSSRRGVVDALQGISLRVEKGECFGLLGPNGAGKTTAVEILEGLLQPTSGQVQVLGQEWGAGHDGELRQKIGLTLQESRFQEKLSVIEILRLFRSFYHQGLEPEEALSLVELEEKATSWVRDLSGGQRQRLAVATALVGSPELLFLDEPTTGLDPQARRQLWSVIENWAAMGKTILITTHYMEEAEKLCNRVAIIDHGRVIAEGTPRELIARLGGEHVIQFRVHELDGQRVSFEEMRELQSVTEVSREGDYYLLTVGEPHLSVPALLGYLSQQRANLENLSTRHANLEDVFVKLTGKHLRDD